MKRIQDILTEVATGLSTEQTAKVDKRLDPLKDSSKQYLLVNMRLARYNTEHNIDTNKIEQIAGLCKEKGLTMVAVGAYDNQQHTGSDKSLWEQYFGNSILDIYGANDRLPEHKPFDHDDRETIYFWLQVSAQDNIVGFIGGRSGSMDIAAFSGVRTLSWDKENWDDSQDPQFVRLFLAHPIMSIATLDGNNNLPSEEIKKWLDGKDICPTPPAGISSKVLTKLEFPNHKLPYLNSYREEKGPVPPIIKRACSPNGEQYELLKKSKSDNLVSSLSTPSAEIAHPILPNVASKDEGIVTNTASSDVSSESTAEKNKLAPTPSAITPSSLSMQGATTAELPKGISPESYREKERRLTKRIAEVGQSLKKSDTPTPPSSQINSNSNNNASNNSDSSSDGPEASSSPDHSSVTKPSLRRS